MTRVYGLDDWIRHKPRIETLLDQITGWHQKHIFEFTTNGRGRIVEYQRYAVDKYGNMMSVDGEVVVVRCRVA